MESQNSPHTQTYDESTLMDPAPRGICRKGSKIHFFSKKLCEIRKSLVSRYDVLNIISGKYVAVFYIGYCACLFFQDWPQPVLFLTKIPKFGFQLQTCFIITISSLLHPSTLLCIPPASSRYFSTGTTRCDDHLQVMSPKNYRTAFSFQTWNSSGGEAHSVWAMELITSGAAVAKAKTILSLLVKGMFSARGGADSPVPERERQRGCPNTTSRVKLQLKKDATTLRTRSEDKKWNETETFTVRCQSMKRSKCPKRITA